MVMPAVFPALLALIACAGLLVAVRRVAVLGAICATIALVMAAYALLTGTPGAALAALALLGLGTGVTIVGEIVWRALGDDDA